MRTSKKKQLKIVVTGGAGFIGSHIVDAYIAAGHHVAIIDDFSTGLETNLNPAATCYRVDVRDTRQLKRVFMIEQPDVVNHQAALVSVTASTSNPLLAYEVNTVGTINVLIASLPFIHTFILASTGGAMYAKPKQFPARETEVPTPLSPYGFSKQLAEEAVRFYCGQHNVNFSILRYANVFGPRQNPHGESGVVAIFSELARHNKRPTIYRRETTRDYVYVADVARANLLALTRGTGETVNIGTAKEVSNQQVFETVATVFGWRTKPFYKPARPGELLRSSLANTKAARVLGWKPTTNLAQGLHLLYAGKR